MVNLNTKKHEQIILHMEKVATLVAEEKMGGQNDLKIVMKRNEWVGR